MQQQGDAEVAQVQTRISELVGQAGEVEGEVRDKEEGIKSLQTELELQSGGEVRELTDSVDQLSKKYVAFCAHIARPLPDVMYIPGTSFVNAGIQFGVGEIGMGPGLQLYGVLHIITH
jgi:hypothetical protein